jgi:hypothetical protein
MSDIAYNAGLEIRYAIASSGIDPIQHIPEVDAIIERRLAEARRKAFTEAAEIAYVTCAKTRHVKLGDACATALRAKAESE